MKPTWILSPPRSGSIFLKQILDRTCGIEQNREGNKPSLFQYRTTGDGGSQNVNYVLLKNDYIHLAVSSIMAIETDFYRMAYGEQEVRKYETIDFPPYDVVRNELIKCYSIVKKTCIQLNEFLKNRSYVEINYQELSQTPRKAVEKILKYVRFEGNPDWNWEEQLFLCELNHPKRNEYIERLDEDVRTLFV